MLFEIDVSLTAESGFHVIIPVQVVQSGLGDVDTPERIKTL